MVDESVLPEDVGTGAPYGDFDDAANLASMVHRPNSTDFVISGIGLNPDYDDMMCYTDAGRAIVGDTDAQATESDELREYGVAYSAILKARTSTYENNSDVLELTADAENYVYVAVNLDQGDTPYIYVDQNDTGPTDPSFKIGMVDTATETVTLENQNPTTSHQDVTIDRSLDVGTDTDIGGDVTIDRSLDVGTDTDIGGDVTIDRSLDVGGDTTVGGSLDVTDGPADPQDDDGVMRQVDTYALSEAAHWGDSTFWQDTAEFDEWTLDGHTLIDDDSNENLEVIDPDETTPEWGIDQGDGTVGILGTVDANGSRWQLEASNAETSSSDSGAGDRNGEAKIIARSVNLYDMTGWQELHYSWENVGAASGSNYSRFGLIDSDGNWGQYVDKSNTFSEITDGNGDPYVLNLSNVDGEWYIAAIAHDQDSVAEAQSDLRISLAGIYEDRLQSTSNTIRYQQGYAAQESVATSPTFNPTAIDRWDIFDYDIDVEDEADYIQFDILDSSDNVLLTNVRKGEILSNIDETESIKIRARFFREDVSDSPLLQSVSFSWIDRTQDYTA